MLKIISSIFNKIISKESKIGLKYITISLLNFGHYFINILILKMLSEKKLNYKFYIEIEKEKEEEKEEETNFNIIKKMENLGSNMIKKAESLIDDEDEKEYSTDNYTLYYKYQNLLTIKYLLELERNPQINYSPINTKEHLKKFMKDNELNTITLVINDEGRAIHIDKN